MCATYEVVRSNTKEARERKRWKLRTARVTLTFDFSSSKWCTSHCPLMCCRYATYEVIQTNRDEATERTGPKLETTPVTFDLWSWIWHATHRSLMCSMYATYDAIQIGTRQQSRQGQNLKRPVWPWPMTFRPENWAWLIYEVIRSVKEGATERTQQNLQMTCVTLTFDLWIGEIGTELQSGHGKHFERPVWPWPLTFDPENGMRHIVPSCVVCMPHMKRFGQIGTEPRSGHGKN